MNSMRATNKRLRQALVTVVLLVAAGVASSVVALTDERPADESRPMPAFELETLDGARFSSQSLVGKVILIDLWATWCKPCVEDIPPWNKLQQRYHDRGFTILGITVQSGWVSDIKDEIGKYDFSIDYPVVVGDDKIEDAFGGVLGFPTAFLITREGKIYKKYSGQYANRRAEIEADIKKLLSQKR